MSRTLNTIAFSAEELTKEIRNNTIVGNGTCSFVDECLTDDELWEEVLMNNSHDFCSKINSLEEAVMHFIKLHMLHAERAEDIRNA